MPKYTIVYERTELREAVVTAADESEAARKFRADEFDSDELIKHLGSPVSFVNDDSEEATS